MKPLLILFLFSTLFSQAFAQSSGETCPDVNAKQLGVLYTNQKGFGQVSWRVWRQPNQVAYEYPDKGIIEVWQLEQQKVTFTRYFTAEQRGIYYSNGDLKSINQEVEWQQVNEMLPPARRAQLGEPSLKQDTCFHYSQYQQQGQLSLTWNNDLNLPILVVNSTTGQRSQQIKLLDSAQSKTFFAQLESYQLLDFADIGDSESDPFVRKMIKLGYVNHANHSNYPNGGHQH